MLKQSMEGGSRRLLLLILSVTGSLQPTQGIDCSAGCKDGVCNQETGYCECQQWWVETGTCDTHVTDDWKIPRHEVDITDITASGAMVTWQTIKSLPDSLQPYYKYQLEYRVASEVDWVVPDTLDHRPNIGDKMQKKLTNLDYGTRYWIQVKSVRMVRESLETTEETYEVRLITLCLVPETPEGLQVAATEQANSSISITVTWQTPPTYEDCREIIDIDVWWKVSGAGKSWSKRDLDPTDTSTTLEDLPKDSYLIRLTVRNQGRFENYEEAELNYNCEQTGGCTCHPGSYGVGGVCYPCSEGCRNDCDVVHGNCSCKQWWDGNKCRLEIESLTLPSDAITIRAATLTESSVTADWQPISNVPSDLGDNYEYVFRYVDLATNTSVEVTRISHSDTMTNGPKEVTLSGLHYNTEYSIVVQAYRVVGSEREQTDAQSVTFVTLCVAPSKPENVMLSAVIVDDKLTLTVTWKPPDIVGCRSIQYYEIWYDAAAATTANWSVTNTTSSGSYLLEYLIPRDYKVMVLAYNDASLSNSTEVFYDMETECMHCVDPTCITDVPCEKCEAGWQPPQCQILCSKGMYGIGCTKSCSAGCVGVCEAQTGNCDCQDWWVHDTCDLYIPGTWTIPTSGISQRSVSSSSITVTWQAIVNLPEDLKPYYGYDVEYAVSGTSDWVVHSILNHEPDAEGYMQETLTRLHYGTMYDLQVKSWREVRELLEQTGNSAELALTTLCLAPDSPNGLQISSEATQETATLNVSWKAPDPYMDCRAVTDISVWYRLASSTDNGSWAHINLDSTTTWVLLPDLVPGQYTVKLTVTNAGGLSASTDGTTIVAMEQAKGGNGNDNDAGMIAGIILLVILILVFGAITVVIVYRRRNKPKRGAFRTNTDGAHSQPSEAGDVNQNGTKPGPIALDVISSGGDQMPAMKLEGVTTGTSRTEASPVINSNRGVTDAQSKSQDSSPVISHAGSNKADDSRSVILEVPNRDQYMGMAMNPEEGDSHHYSSVISEKDNKCHDADSVASEARVKPDDTIVASEARVKPDDTIVASEARVKPDDTIVASEARVKSDDTIVASEARVKPDDTSVASEASVKPDDTIPVWEEAEGNLAHGNLVKSEPGSRAENMINMMSEAEDKPDDSTSVMSKDSQQEDTHPIGSLSEADKKHDHANLVISEKTKEAEDTGPVMSFKDIKSNEPSHVMSDRDNEAGNASPVVPDKESNVEETGSVVSQAESKSEELNHNEEHTRGHHTEFSKLPMDGDIIVGMESTDM